MRSSTTEKMSDSEIDEEYFYSDNDQEINEMDVDEETFHVDNLFWEGEDLVKENPTRAIILFENILCLESDRQNSKWSAQSLVHLIHLYGSMNHDVKIVACFEELCRLAAATVSFEIIASVNAVLDRLENDMEQELILKLCTIAINCFQNVPSTNSSTRLRFNANLKIASIHLSNQNYQDVEAMIRNLKDFCGCSVGSFDANKSGYLMEVYGLELMLCNSISDRYRRRSVYRETLKLKSALVPAKVMAVIQEEGGKIRMSESDWSGAFNEFYQAFKYHRDRDSARTGELLKFTVLSGSLAGICNSWVSLEAKNYSNVTLNQLLTKLKANFVSRCERGLSILKNPMLHRAWILTKNTPNTAVPGNRWLTLPNVFELLDAVDFHRLMMAYRSSDLSFVQRNYAEKMLNVNLQVEETLFATVLWCKEIGKPVTFRSTPVKRKVETLLSFYGKVFSYFIDYQKLESVDIDCPMENVNIFVDDWVSALEECKVRYLPIRPLFRIPKYILIPLIMDWIVPEDFWMLYRSIGYSDVSWLQKIMSEFPSQFCDYVLRHIKIVELAPLVHCLKSTQWPITESMQKKKLSIVSCSLYGLHFSEFELINKFTKLLIDPILWNNNSLLHYISKSHVRHLELTSYVSNPHQLTATLPFLETLDINCDDSFLSRIIVQCRKLRALSLRCCPIGERIYFLFAFHGVALESLKIADRFIKDNALSLILLLKGSKLRLLCLHNAEALTDDIISSLIVSTPNLTSLSLLNSIKISVQEMSKLLRHLQLRSLTSGSNRNGIDSVFWNALIQSDLRFIGFSNFSWNVTLENPKIFRCIHLQSLSLKFCKLSNTLLLTLLSCQIGDGLIHVDVSGNDLSSETLCDAVRYLKGVTHLNISENQANNKVLGDIANFCPNLKVLDIFRIQILYHYDIDCVLKNGQLRSLKVCSDGFSLSGLVDSVICAPSLLLLKMYLERDWAQDNEMNLARLEKSCPRLKIIVNDIERRRHRVAVWDFESDFLMPDYQD